MSIETLVSVVALLGAAASVIINLRKAPSDIKLTQADATEKISKAAGVMVASMHARIQALETDLAEACKKIETLKDARELDKGEIELLREQVRTLKGDNQALATQIEALTGGNQMRMEEIANLNERVKSQENEIVLLHHWADRLVGQLEKHNITPEPFIPTTKKDNGKGLKQPPMGGSW